MNLPPDFGNGNIRPIDMAAINRAAEAERVKRQLEADLDAADSFRRQVELRLSVTIREGVKELADATAKAVIARNKLNELFPNIGEAA